MPYDATQNCAKCGELSPWTELCPKCATWKRAYDEGRAFGYSAGFSSGLKSASVIVQEKHEELNRQIEKIRGGE